MIEQIKQNLSQRPHWMNAVLFFCLYMTFIYLPWDIFVKPIAEDQEVWFGILFYGWLAKLGGLLHWLVYGAGAFGLWKMKRWLHPWIELYLVQVALSMVITTFIAVEGSAALLGLVVGSLFLLLAWRFYLHRDKFTTE